MKSCMPWVIDILSNGDPSSNPLKVHSLGKKQNQTQKSYTINTKESINLGNH